MQMFSKKEPSMSFDLVIGPNSLVNGNLESEASIRVDGKVIGNITSKGNVILSDKGVIEGDITCENLEVHGSCTGNIKAKGKIELSSSSKLIGDIICKTLNTDQGASFEGNCKVVPEYDLYIETQMGQSTMNASYAQPSYDTSNSDTESDYDADSYDEAI